MCYDGFSFRQKESLGATVTTKKMGLTMTCGGAVIGRGRVYPHANPEIEDFLTLGVDPLKGRVCYQRSYPRLFWPGPELSSALWITKTHIKHCHGKSRPWERRIKAFFFIIFCFPLGLVSTHIHAYFYCQTCSIMTTPQRGDIKIKK